MSSESDAEPLVEDLPEDSSETGIRETVVTRRRRHGAEQQQVQHADISSTTTRDGNNNPSNGSNRIADTGKAIRSSGSPVKDASNNSMTRDEYISCLNHWNVSVKAWQSYQETLAATILASSLIAASAILPAPNAAVHVTSDSTDRSRTAAAASATTESSELRLYRIPKLWKRLAAEMIDFMFLLVIKIIVTFIAIEYFKVIDLSKFDFSLVDAIDSGEGTSLSEDLDAALSDAYRLAFELTSEILVIESIHRVIVIVYETLFLMRSFFQRRSDRVSYGGATPGKFIMGLRVVSCISVTEFVSDGVAYYQITPGREIGFGWSLLRAMVKNFSSVFFLPASLTVLISRYNRAAYDIVCRSQVVEE